MLQITSKTFTSQEAESRGHEDDRMAFYYNNIECSVVVTIHLTGMDGHCHGLHGLDDDRL